MHVLYVSIMAQDYCTIAVQGDVVVEGCLNEYELCLV